MFELGNNQFASPRERMWILVLTLPVLWTPEASASRDNLNSFSPRGNNETAAETQAACNATLADYDLQWDDAPFSCQARCGSQRETPCSCDALCAFYGDCCGDFELQCPEIETYRPTFHSDKDGNATGVAPQGQDGYIPLAECARFNSRLISSCPSTFAGSSPEAELLDSRCRIDVTSPGAGVQDMLPMTDQSTGLHYKNVHCLQCNGGKAADGLAWTLKFTPGVRYRGQFQTLQDALTIAKLNTTINTFASPPEGIQQRFCISVTTWGRLTAPCECDNLKDLCQQNDEILKFDKRLFRNRYCLLCFLAMEDSRDIRAWSIDIPNVDEIRHSFRSFSFSVVLEWSAASTENEKVSSAGVKDIWSTAAFAGSVSLYVDNYLPWRRMDCRETRSTTTTRLDDQADVKTTEGSDSKTRSGINALSDLDAESEGSKQETASNADQRGSGEGEGAADLDPVSCTQHDCRPGVFHVQGQCIYNMFGCQATASFLGREQPHSKANPGSQRQAVEDRLEDDLTQAINRVNSVLSVVEVNVDYVTLTENVLNVSAYTTMPRTDLSFAKAKNLSEEACRRVHDIVRATLVQEVGDDGVFSLCVRREMYADNIEPCMVFDDDDDDGGEVETTEPGPASRGSPPASAHQVPALGLSWLLTWALAAR